MSHSRNSSQLYKIQKVLKESKQAEQEPRHVTRIRKFKMRAFEEIALSSGYMQAIISPDHCMKQ